MSDEILFETVKLSLRFRVPDFMPAVYAHHMLVQPVEHEIMITFFQLQSPPIGGTKEDVERQIAAVRERGFVDSDCVAKIFVSKATFPQFAKAMNEFLTSYVDERRAEDADRDSGTTAESGGSTEG